MNDIIKNLENRVLELNNFLNQSLANHHTIAGRLEEAKEMLAAAHREFGEKSDETVDK